VKIPASVEVIGQYCFHDCQFLCEVDFEADSQLKRVEKGAFSWTGLERVMIPRSVEVLDDDCLAHTELCEISFEAGSKVRELGTKVFCGCRLEGTVKIPASVEVIRSLCFMLCRPFHLIEFGTGSKLQRLEKSVFWGTLLKRITIPATVEFIGEGCFSECTVMATVMFESGSKLREIGARAFYQTHIDKITIPRGVETIGEECFCLCNIIHKITFEGKISGLTPQMFEGCVALRRIRVPRGVQVDKRLVEDIQIEYLSE
jgi:hypothetical protein